MEEQNLVTLNQESLVIVIQVLDVLEKIQKKLPTHQQNYRHAERSRHYSTKAGKKTAIPWKNSCLCLSNGQENSELNQVLINYPKTLKTRTENVKQQLMSLQQ